MNDEFLTLHRPAVRPQFAAGLYDRLNRPTRVQSAKDYLHTRRGLATALAALLLLAACAREIQQALGPNYHLAAELGGIAVYEMNYRIELIPNQENEIVKVWRTTSADWQPLRTATIIGESPYELTIPAYIPSHFSSPEAMTQHPIWMAQDQPAFHVLRWQTESRESAIYLVTTGRTLPPIFLGLNPVTTNVPQLVLQPTDWQATILKVAPEKWGGTQVNGQPAVVVRGDWSIPQSNLMQLILEQDGWTLSVEVDEPRAEKIFWEDRLGLHLYWTDGSYLFHLAVYGEFLQLEDLIAIAESIH